MERTSAYRAAVQLPGKSFYPFIGNAFELCGIGQEELFVKLRQFANEFKCSYRFYSIGVLHFNVIRAKDIELLTNNTKHTFKTFVYEFLHPFLRTGLLTSDGTKWMKRRRVLTPGFHFNMLQDFLIIFREESTKFVDRIKCQSESNNNNNNRQMVAIIDLLKVIPRFTLNTICETAMGVKLETLSEANEYRLNVIKIGELLVYRIVHPHLFFNFLYNLTNLPKTLATFTKPAHAFTANIIDKRRQEIIRNPMNNQMNNNNNNNNNIDNHTEIRANTNVYESKRKRFAMLDTLLLAESKRNGDIDADGIQEEVDTFMFEGFDTTSSALTFILLTLAHHVSVQEKVYEEIISILGLTPNYYGTIRDFNNMKYLDRVIKETLRLYPPVSFIGRELREPLKLSNGIELPIGTQCHMHIYDLHRDPEQFPNPEKFDPDRFLPDECDKRHPYAYIPFSAGPRNCIGQKFAILEIKTLVSSIIKNFKLSPITKIDEVTFLADLVLRSKYSIKVQFQHRD